MKDTATHHYTERLNSFTWATWLIHMRDMTHSYVWHDSFICVTWLIHIRDMTHSYVWHDSFISETWLTLHTWDIRLKCTHIFFSHKRALILTKETHDEAMNDTATCHYTERLNSFIWATWLLHMSDMTHLYERHDSFFTHDIYVWNIHTFCARVRYMCLTHTSLCMTKSPTATRWMTPWQITTQRDLTHSYERHDSFISETSLILDTWDIRVNYTHIFFLRKRALILTKETHDEAMNDTATHHYTWDIRVKYTHISRTCEIYGECWIRCLKVQVCFLKRAINYVALLRKMTYICELIAHSAFAISPTRAQWGTHISASDKGPQGKRRITFFHMKESCRSYEWVKSLCVVAFVWATWLLHMKDRRTRNDVRREATNTIVRNNIARHKQQHCQKQATTLSETSGKRRMILLETTSLRGTLWVLRKCHVRMCACFFVWKYRALLSHDKSALCHVTKEPYIFTQKSPMTQRWITPFKMISRLLKIIGLFCRISSLL